VAISYVGGASGVTSATLPAHEIGDLILAFAFRDGSTTAPTLGSGFTSTTTQTGTSSSCRVGFRRATVTNTATGTWTNATSVIFVIYRDVGAIGGFSSTSGSSTTINYPEVTLTDQAGSSWVAGFSGHRSTNVAIETAPLGMVNRVSVSDATDEAAAHDTNGGLTSFAARTAEVGGTSSGWVSATVELIDGSATASVTGEQLLADNFIYPSSSNWYPWYFEPRTVGYSGESNITQDGEIVTSSFSEVIAVGEQSALIGIEGIDLLTGFETISAEGQIFATIAIDGINLSTEIEPIAVNADGFIVLEPVLSTSSAENVSSSGSGLAESPSNELNSSFGSIAITVDDIELINGITIQSDIEPIFAAGNALKNVDGLDANSDFGTVLANGGESLNSDISINGIGLVSSIGSISAKAENPQTFAGGTVKRYPANAFKNSVVKISGIAANSSQNAVIAVGFSKINATIMLDNVVSFTQIANINAEGVLSINEEEVILLMAA